MARFYGTNGNDTLIGSIGTDILRGGAGDDTYLIDDSNDAIIELTQGSIQRASSDNLGVEGSASSYNPLISADANKILFYSEADNLIADDTNFVTDIFVKDLMSGEITRISTNALNEQGDGDSYNAIFSADGTKVFFESTATNLIINDSNDTQDIFVKDLITGSVSLVSSSVTNTQGDSYSNNPVLSSDGSQLVFTSIASNLVANDKANTWDVFVKNLLTNTIFKANTTAQGVSGNNYSYNAVISADGNQVAFVSESTNLVLNDVNNVADVFVKNIKTGSLVVASSSPAGVFGNKSSTDPVFSPDGTKVVFSSESSNLITGDDNGVSDIFIKDLITGTISKVSTDASGLQANGASTKPIFSPDGKAIFFISDASNLVVNDTNNVSDVFVKDLTSGLVTRVNSSAAGIEANNSSYKVSISANGVRLAFMSSATNLITDGNVNNGKTDIFVRELADGGNDSVIASVSYTLGDNVEKITLIGNDNINATGNNLDNVLVGNSSGNILNGNEGVDKVVYGLSWLDYDVFQSGSSVVVQEINNKSNRDTLFNVEYIVFNSITVSVADALNDAPIAVDDTNNNDPIVEAGVGIVGDAQAIGNVLVNDTDADSLIGLNDSKKISAINGSSLAMDTLIEGVYGSMLISSNGAYLYTLNDLDVDTQALAEGQTGSDHFTYTVSDGHGATSSAQLTITVMGSNDAPMGESTIVLAPAIEDTPYNIQTIDLLLGFHDAENDTLFVSDVAASRGIVVDNLNGSYSLFSAQNYNGDVFFSYYVNDNHGGRVAVNKILNVSAVNDAPVGVANSTLLVKDYLVYNNDLLQGFTDPDSDSLSTKNLEIRANGSLKNNLDGTYTISPDVNYSDIITLDYDVMDGKGGIFHATKSLIVDLQLEGTSGGDILRGGIGNDIYLINNVHDLVIETGSVSIDTIQSSISYGLGENLENLILMGGDNLSGAGNAADNLIKGNDGNNRLIGSAGSDTLDGGAGGDTLDGGAGADKLYGGSGNDTFTVENVGDLVIELADEGFDTVNSSISYTLTANVERLNLEGFDNLNGFGNELDNTINGNNANNYLWGGAGNDTLNGKGSSDTLEGGLGNDLYYVDNVGDLVIELAGEGTDKVSSVISYTLTANVEHLFLTGIADLIGHGNELNNVIYGNDGNNTLFGEGGDDSINGGAGNDTLIGGAGNDTLVGGLGSDTYLFGIGEGRDLINNADVGNGNDKVLFDIGITADHLWLRQVDNDLEISIVGRADSIKVQNWYSDDAKRVDGFELVEGNVLLASEVQNLVAAMSAFTPPSMGQTSLTSAQHSALDVVIATNWESLVGTA